MSNSEIANRRIGFSEGPGVVIMAIDARRRQARQVVPRPRVVQFSLTEDAFAAEATAYGPDNPWYRRATASGAGRIRAGSIERDVSFAHAAPGAQTGIDAAYHAEYDRYGRGSSARSPVRPRMARLYASPRNPTGRSKRDGQLTSYRKAFANWT
jgi:hypothetical protein